MALDSFKDFYNIVKRHLKLPDLPQKLFVVEYDDMTMCLNWWQDIIFNLKALELDDHFIFAQGKKKDLHKDYLDGPLKARKTLEVLCQKFSDLGEEKEQPESNKDYTDLLVKSKALEEELEKCKADNAKLREENLKKVDKQNEKEDLVKQLLQENQNLQDQIMKSKEELRKLKEKIETD